MALWLVRAGAHGEYEKKFLEEGRIYLTWGGLAHDLGALNDRAALRAIFEKVYPNAAAGLVRNNIGQIWAFVKGIQPGDWIVLPSKHKPAIHIAEVMGDYAFVPEAGDPFFHYRVVKWLAHDIPRSNFDQDLLYSFGAFMTVCQISRNDAEARVRAMAKKGWKTSAPGSISAAGKDESVEANSGLADLALAARDQIAKFITTRFKGHGLARLVDAVLRAQGYVTYLSAEGPDKGIDILAALAPMGFGEPRICVQVKSGDAPLDRPTLDQLVGVMQNVQASNGLLVSWGGFKSSIDKEEAIQFFRVRLWDQDDVIDQVLAHYDKLDEDMRTDLPLKRIWILTQPEQGLGD